MRKFISIISVLLYSGAAGSAGAVTYYVDYAGGLDSNDGLSQTSAWQRSPGDPKATGKPAATTLMAGDTVLFRGGVVYRGSIGITWSGAAGSPITFSGSGWGTPNAIIDGSEPLAGWTACLSQSDCGGNSNWPNIYYVSIPQQTPAVSTFTAIYEGDQFLYFGTDPILPDPLWFNRQSDSFVDSNGVVTNVSYFHQVPAGQMTATSLTDASFFTQSDPAYWKNAYVALYALPNIVAYSPITGYDPATHTISYPATNPNNATGSEYYAMVGTIHTLLAAGEAVVDLLANRIYAWPNNAADLAGNMSLCARQNGINILGHDHLVVQGFKIQKFCAAGLNDYWMGAGIADMYGAPMDVKVAGNEITLVRSMAGTAAIYTGSLIVNNYIHDDQSGAAINVPTPIDSPNPNPLGWKETIKGNTITRVTGHGVWALGALNTEIIGNRIDQINSTHKNAIAVYAGWDGVTTNHGSYNVLIADNQVAQSRLLLSFETSTNVVIVNNIFDGGNLAGSQISDWGGMTGILKIFNNLMLRVDGGSGLLLQSCNATGVAVENNVLGGGGCMTGHSNNIYTGLSWWQTPTEGWSLGPGESVLLGTSAFNALFIDYPHSNYQPTVISPAIDQGVDVSNQLPASLFSDFNFNQDVAGVVRPQGLTWDIGPYEFTGTGPAPTITIGAPTAGAVVSGVVTVSGSAAGTGISSVTVSIDGGPFLPASGTTAWSYSWNTFGLFNGAHTIIASAWTAQNRGYSALITVTIANTAGPIAWWKFDEGAGGVASDSSGSGDTGTLKGSYSWTVGISTSSHAVALDGSTGFMDSTTTFNNPQLFTLSIWFKTTTAAGGPMIAFGNSWPYYGRHIFMSNTGQIWFGVSDNPDDSQISSLKSCNDGLWHQAAASWSQYGMRLYVDGVIQSSGPAVADVRTDHWVIGYGDVYNWNTPPGNPSSHFKGSIADARVYGRVLSDPEVAQLYQSWFASPPTVSLISLNGVTAANAMSVKSPVYVALSGSDSVAVTKVELWSDGSLILTQAFSPPTPAFSINLNWSATVGSHTLQAKAYDQAGNSAVSGSPISVTVTHRRHPVSLQSIAQSGAVTADSDGTAAGDARALVVSRQSLNSQNLVFDPDIQEAKIINLQGRTLAAQTSSGGPIVMALQNAGDSRMPMESGLWLIQMKDSSGHVSVKPLVAVK